MADLDPAVVERTRDVDRVISDLAGQFGPGMSNGVMCILLHPDLPERFSQTDWKEWFFKPAPKAFAWAHDRGLIAPWKLSSKWCFTKLGTAVARYAQAELAREGGAG